jgi:hypothetical protein
VTAVVALWAAAIAVTGATTCPSPAEVTSALVALLPAPAVTGAVEARAELVAEGASLQLRLLGPDGRVLSEKGLPREESCAVMADTAAVVLAAWAARLNADVSLAFEAPRSTTAASTPLATAAPPDRAAPRWVASLGAGLFASFQDTFDAPTAAPAGSLELGVRGVRGVEEGWGARLGIAATGSHRNALGPGQALWQRLGVSLGASRRKSWGRVSLTGGLDLIAALLFVEGDGFTTGRDVRTWDVGPSGSARLGLGVGRVEPWVAVGGAVWLRSQLIEVTGVAEQHRLSRLQLLAGAGLTVLFSD